MDADLRQALAEINGDIKRLLPLVDKVERHEEALYGNSHDGLIVEVTKLKQTHKLYNKALTALGAVVTAITTNVVWKWLK